MNAKPTLLTVDGNEAAAYVAYRLNEVMAIYPITPSSPIAEWCDQWASEGKKNLWGTIPAIMEMQSEGGAVGAVHGMLQTGSLSTTFTASQGLLLMIPNMFKIAGELLPTVFHVTARDGGHPCAFHLRRSQRHHGRRGPTGWAMLGAASRAGGDGFCADFPGGHAARRGCRSSISSTASAPRTRLQKLKCSTEDVMRALIDDKLIAEHPRAGDDAGPAGAARHGAKPRRVFPGPRGGQSVLCRLPGHRAKGHGRISANTPGAQYHLFDYVGAPDAEHVIVLMGSGCEAAHETVEHLNARGEKARPGQGALVPAV